MPRLPYAPPSARAGAPASPLPSTRKPRITSEPPAEYALRICRPNAPAHAAGLAQHVSAEHCRPNPKGAHDAPAGGRSTELEKRSGKFLTNDKN